MDDIFFTPAQGWQCQICGRVYSPTTSMCRYCNTGTINTTSTGNFKVEYGRTDNKTEGGGEDVP